MKITLALLVLGTGLVLSNAFSVAKPSMQEHEAFSAGRMVSLLMSKHNSVKNCNRCSEQEMQCRMRAMVEDACFILRLTIHDMGLSSARELLRQKTDVKIEIDFEIVVTFIEINDQDALVRYLTRYNKHEAFIKYICAVLKGPLKDCGIDLFKVLLEVNEALGGIITGVLSAVQDIFGIIGAIVGGVGKTVDGLVGGLTGNLVGGLGDAVGGLTGGLTGGLGGVVGGLTGGLTSNLGGAVGGLTGGLGGTVGGLTGAVGGLAGSVGGITGGLKGALGGLTGGRRGGIFG
ncbi:uncharacterized protein [Hyperolius riggenbachi]|uniref:uncharacterized protein n=1 Tax=Hyperolius riggenbachi TaxID=752182 RepID=UPI0035A38DB0